MTNEDKKIVQEVHSILIKKVRDKEFDGKSQDSIKNEIINIIEEKVDESSDN
jgi:hypothetical protein